METMKLTPQELEKLQYYQQQINQNIFDLGQLEISIHNLKETLKNADSSKVDILSTLETLADQEKVFLDELEIKYGKGLVDPTTGEITSS